MKTLVLISLFITLSCTNLVPGRFLASTSYNVVLDIDYTIVQPANKDEIKNVITINGERYRIRPWALDMITALSEMENVNVYFFSGGKIDRNEKLLKELKLTNNKTAHDIQAGIYSYSDLTEVSTEGGFSDRLKKNLPFSAEKLKRTILVDDNADFSMPDQIRNMLWIGETFHHYESFEASQLDIGNPKVRQEYLPKSYHQWKNSEDNILYVTRLITDAISADEKGEMTFLSYIEKNRKKYLPTTNKPSTFQDTVFRTTFSKNNNLCQEYISNFQN